MVAAPSRKQQWTRLKVESLEDVVAESAVATVRLTWVGSRCWGTVLRSMRAFCCVIHPIDSPITPIDAIPTEWRQDLICQGRAGAVAGVLLWCRPRRTWHWVGWATLSRQKLDRFIRLGDHDVTSVGEDEVIDFGAIVQQEVGVGHP